MKKAFLLRLFFIALRLSFSVRSTDEESFCKVKKTNRIVKENLLPGSPTSEWDINGAGDPTIQGFATDSSINIGQTSFFKIKCTSPECKYRADIYRLGWYGGSGARRIITIRPTEEQLQQSIDQPHCLYDHTTHEVDCSNWNVSLSWTIPSTAVSGLYFARIVRVDDELIENWRVDNSQLNYDVRFSRPKQDQDPFRRPPIIGKHSYGAAGRTGKPLNSLKEPRASHVLFVVRDTDFRTEQADILIQTMDTTWHAYNCWGSLNTYGFPCDDSKLHAGSPQYQAGYYNRGNETTDQYKLPPRAYRVSLNRPIATRAYRAVNMPFNAEYPLIRWIERNGYDVTYWSGIDTHRFGSKLYKNKNSNNSSSVSSSVCKLFISQSHDEYWSREQRYHVTNARDVSGINLAFFSGNEMYWKIRYENDYRTIVVYKDSQEIKQLDPVEWTGTWRDDRPINKFGSKPENELSGTIFTVNAHRHDALEVPRKFRLHRFWRNTRVATAREENVILLSGLLGHEWDEDIDNGFRPPGLQHMSETTINNVQYLMDEGSVFDSGTATHHLVMYRHPPTGSLVFGAGTCQWSWGLDNEHDSCTGVPAERNNFYSVRICKDQHGPDKTIQQATINLFADAHIFPSTIQDDLTLTMPSNDTDPPKSTITKCYENSHDDLYHSDRIIFSCEGAARDSGGGSVAAVEYAIMMTNEENETTETIASLWDNKLQWHPAIVEAIDVTAKFAFNVPIRFIVVADDLGSTRNLVSKLDILTRSVDDSGNFEMMAATTPFKMQLSKELIS